MWAAEGVERHCPHCHNPVNASTGFDFGRGPWPGDVAVCFYCDGVSMFRVVLGGLALVALSEEQAAIMETDPPIAAMRETVRMRRGDRGNV